MSKHEKVLAAMAQGETVLCRSNSDTEWGEIGPNSRANFNPFSYPEWEWKVKGNPIKDAFETTVEQGLPNLLHLPIKDALYQVFDIAFKEGVNACQRGDYY